METKKMYINGQWTQGSPGTTSDVVNPFNGEILCRIWESSLEDVREAIKAAKSAFYITREWRDMDVEARSRVLLKVADLIEENQEEMAAMETQNMGKPLRESLIDIADGAGTFRYYAGLIQAPQGGICSVSNGSGEIHSITVHEPVGVCAQITPWNYPFTMAAWKLAPVLAAGCCSVLKPAEQTPVTIMLMMDLIKDILPPGVVNVVNGFGAEAGQALATSNRIQKLAFTGSTEVGAHLLRCAADKLIPSTVELGGKSPNIYFADVMQHESSYIDKAVEGMLMTFFNQGEVCTCPSRALVQASIYDDFMDRVLARARTIVQGNPLDTTTQVGAQASREQFDKILSYMEIGRGEGAKMLLGGGPAKVSGLEGGFYIQPTIFSGQNKMRVFQEEIFGPALGVTTFKDEADALAIANDTQYGLGAGLWTRDSNLAWRMGRGIQAGRVWVNCYHAYPAHAAFGGYKKSGIGRETHKMMLDHYQNTKNLLVSHDINPLGFF